MARGRKKSGKFLTVRHRKQVESVVLVFGTLAFAVLLFQSAQAFGQGPAGSPLAPLSPTPLGASPTPAPTPAPTPKPTPAPVAIIKRVVPVSPTRRAVAARPARVVVAVPGSSVVGLTPTTPPSGSGAQATPTPGPTTSPSPPPGMTTGYISSNWSGYLMTGGSFTAISGSWTATSPTGINGEESADATWIGIGGVTASDLIQVGTQNIISPSGQVFSSAFYEILPASSTDIPALPVAPGDRMSASITETSAGQWTITINDETSGQSDTQNVAYSSSLSSAEWIEEDPATTRSRLIPFDGFGLAVFGGAETTDNGSGVDLTEGNAQPITMVNRADATIALPSAISGDGRSFSVSP